MGKPRYDLATATFPYKISKRLNMMAFSRRPVINQNEGMPAVNDRGIRKSALRAHCTDRVTDIAWPYLRRLLIIKRTYKSRFTPERVERIDRMIEASNATCYSKLASCTIDLKKQEGKDVKKKKGWTESEWKKHMDYIGQLAKTRKGFKPEPIQRGPHKPLPELLVRLQTMASLPHHKMYKRMSQENWYRDPKVRRSALKYVISERVKKLAIPKKQPTEE